MPDIPSDSGLSAFFKTLGQNVFMQQQEKQRQQEEIRKSNAERFNQMQAQGRLIVPGSNPAITTTPAPAMPLDASGLNEFVSGQVSGPQNMPMLQGPVVAPTPSISNGSGAHMPTLQEQNEYASAIRAGKEPKTKIETQEPVVPDWAKGEDVSKSTKVGDITYSEDPSKTKRANAYVKSIDEKRKSAYSKAGSTDEYMKAYAQARAQVTSNKNSTSMSEDEQDSLILDITNEILDSRKQYISGASPAKKTPAPVALPAGVTEQDIQYTMKTRKMTRQQVLDAFNKKNRGM